jgi:hypothetical protein
MTAKYTDQIFNIKSVREIMSNGKKQNWDSKFAALHLLLEQIRESYHQLQDEKQKSFLEVVVGAAIFYLPSTIGLHFSGYTSVAAMKGFIKGQRRVKDHIYPRKQAAVELLNQSFSVEELKNKYHNELAQFMYVTSTENSLLVNFHQDHSDHDSAMTANRIEKFPSAEQGKFKNHKELNDFMLYIRKHDVDNIDVQQLGSLLDEFRKQSA